jgi:hypothetical protein
VVASPLAILIMSRTRKLPDTLYHLVEAVNLDSVRSHGLKPAADLIAAARHNGSNGDASFGLLPSTHRLRHTVLPDGVNLRDQKPMPPAALSRCLRGMTPPDWYEWLNQHVFFWLARERAERQMRACAPRPQFLLSIDTSGLLGAYGDAAYLTPINTGNARRNPTPRNRSTFVPYADWVARGWEAETIGVGKAARDPYHAPVELAIRGAVLDIGTWIRDVEVLGP